MPTEVQRIRRPQESSEFNAADLPSHLPQLRSSQTIPLPPHTSQPLPPQQDLPQLHSSQHKATQAGADTNNPEGGARIYNRAQSVYGKFLGHAHFQWPHPQNDHKLYIYIYSSTNGWSKATFQHFWRIFIVSFMVNLSLEAGGGYSSVLYLERPTFGAGGGATAPLYPPLTRSDSIESWTTVYFHSGLIHLSRIHPSHIHPSMNLHKIRFNR